MKKSFFYREYPPSPVLAPYVRCYARLEYHLDENTRLLSERLPFGGPFLNVTYQGDAGAEVLPFENKDITNDHTVGQMLKHFYFHHSGNVGFFGVFFHPIGVHYLLREHMQEFTQRAISIEDAAGSSGRQLVTQIKSTRSSEEMIEAIEKFLQTKLQHSAPEADDVDHAISLIYQNPTLPLDQIHRYLRISPRHLLRKFQEKVGIGPKYYHRICRFHHALRLGRSSQHLDLQDLAFLCGYYDQSHFMKDFKVFAGSTPGEYFQKNNRHVEVGGILQQPD